MRSTRVSGRSRSRVVKTMSAVVIVIVSVRSTVIELDQRSKIKDHGDGDGGVSVRGEVQGKR